MPCRASRRRAASGVLALLLPLASARAEDALGPIRADAGGALLRLREMRLEVFINGHPTRSIEAFRFDPERGRLSATRGDLEGTGIRVPGQGPPGEMWVLEDLLPGRYRFDEANQSVHFTLDDAQRQPRTYDARHLPDVPAARSDLGALLNYRLFAGAGGGTASETYSFTGANATLEARVFGAFGALIQTGIVGTTTLREADLLRLETAYAYADPGSAVAYRAGDTISGGLPWTRPIRLGGLQVARDFTLRPDLVTAPLPQITGSAAVPSAVDVFINGVKAHTQEVAAGPFSITNLPLLSAGGTARVVVRDVSGREVETSVPLVRGSTLLAEGLTSFSAEAGFARLGYGTPADAYNPAPVAAATARHGLLDWLTGEAHLEGGSGLANGGVGGVAQLGRLGLLSASGSGSSNGDRTGFQLFGTYEAQVWDLSFRVASQRGSGRYDDLASVTSRLPAPDPTGGPWWSAAQPAPRAGVGGQDPPKGLDLVSVGAPVPWAGGHFTLGYVDVRRADQPGSRLVTASYVRELPYRASLAVTAFGDARDRGSGGAFVSVSVPLGPSASLAASAEWSRAAGASAGFQAQKAQGREEDSYGWRLRGREGAGPAYREAAASYRTSSGLVGATLRQSGSALNVQAQAEGAVAATGGGLVTGNRVEGGFAVVDAGAPGIPVLQDNRPIGATGWSGRYLASDLRAHQRNQVGIDPAGLPLDADVPRTDEVVAPTALGGVHLDFGVRRREPAAVVALTGANGRALPAGSTGRLEGGGTFIVGYDGRAYVKGLRATNTVVVETGTAECRATFPFLAGENAQVLIRDVVCR